MRICSIGICEKEVHGHGLCSKHYTRLRKHGDPMVSKYNREHSGCQVDDCNNKYEARGYCVRHIRQVEKHGRVLTEDEVHQLRSEKSTRVLLKYYKENPDRPKRKISPEKREAMKGVCKNTGRTHFPKGFIPWNKGKKGLVVPWNKGKSKYSEIDKLTNRQQRLQSRKLRSLVLARDNDTCQVCECITEYPQVDHIKRWADYPELRFEIDNLRTLCMPCHYFITYKRKLPQGMFWGHRRTT